MTGFLLKTSLEFPLRGDLKIQRAHRGLAPKQTNPQSTPRYITVKIGSRRSKKEVIRRASQKSRPSLPSWSAKETQWIRRSQKSVKREISTQTEHKLQGIWLNEGFQLRWWRNPLHWNKRRPSSYLHGRWRGDRAGNRESVSPSGSDQLKRQRSQSKDALKEFRRKLYQDDAWSLVDSPFIST